MTTGMLIPLYTYPTDGTWEKVAEAKRAHASLPFMAVINPSDGVGRKENLDYTREIPALQSAGVLVLGYVYTGYAKRELSQVQAEVSLFKEWYHVDGIFFDQAAYHPGDEKYYSTLERQVHSLGMSITVANPGTRAPSYLDTAELLVTYENGSLPPTWALEGLAGGRSKNAAIAYNVPVLDAGWLDEAKNYLGYVYVTDRSLPNPYGALPSYFDALVSKLAEL